MNKTCKIVFLILLLFSLVLLAVLFWDNSNIPVLNPKGMVAQKQRDLIVITTLLMLLVVVPVYILTVIIAWKYRAKNTKAKYNPEWDHHLGAEAIWWGFPLAIIVVLSVITWKSCYELDPFKPLSVVGKPLRIQVVALQWKWLFIYPEHHIATVNFVQFPERTPINFEITSDAPMNSFWIPQLGGQIYAMAGMKSKLHLIADEVGSFRGSSANLSGEGFAGMNFMAVSSKDADFHAWVESVKQSSKRLNLVEYNKLVEPSSYDPASLYVLEEENLYEQIVMKYMMPPVQMESMNSKTAK